MAGQSFALPGQRRMLPLVAFVDARLRLAAARPAHGGAHFATSHVVKSVHAEGHPVDSLTLITGSSRIVRQSRIRLRRKLLTPSHFLLDSARSQCSGQAPGPVQSRLFEVQDTFLVISLLLPRGRIELPTQGFSVLRSTTELPRPISHRQKERSLLMNTSWHISCTLQWCGTTACPVMASVRAILRGATSAWWAIEDSNLGPPHYQ